MRMLWITLWMMWTTAALGCGGEAPTPPPPAAQQSPDAGADGEMDDAPACDLPGACAVRGSCAWCGLPGDRGVAMRREGACWVTDHTTSAEGEPEWWAFCPLLTGDEPLPDP
jgi:hypothetical protein